MIVIHLVSSLRRSATDVPDPLNENEQIAPRSVDDTATPKLKTQFAAVPSEAAPDDQNKTTFWFDESPFQIAGSRSMSTLPVVETGLANVPTSQSSSSTSDDELDEEELNEEELNDDELNDDDDSSRSSRTERGPPYNPNRVTAI